MGVPTSQSTFKPVCATYTRSEASCELLRGKLFIEADGTFLDKTSSFDYKHIQSPINIHRDERQSNEMCSPLPLRRNPRPQCIIFPSFQAGFRFHKFRTSHLAQAIINAAPFRPQACSGCRSSIKLMSKSVYIAKGRKYGI